MLFNSIDFAIFLPLVFALYWLFKFSIRTQNILLLIASYIFYGWWDPRFLVLILVSSLIDYFISSKLETTENSRHRKYLLGVSLISNLGILAFFKYFNFFLENFESAFSFFGEKMNVERLDIVLPVGISFYTFQTLSYTIDVYRKKLPASRDLVAFLSFVSFFPQLVAGPIERATHLLPQFLQPRKFNSALATEGLRQMLWGFFKKIVIADNCAEVANQLFDHPDIYPSSSLVFGAILFAFQIYGDFSGYSDIALGTSKLFGFDLMKNFSFPYFSRDIGEFWRRWHISLSTWFRDYLYIPLGGSKGNRGKQIRNTFIIFIVSGFWHGANWTFIVWGGLNALYFLPLLLTSRNRKNLDIVAHNSSLPSLKEFASMLITFGLTTIAWVFFRAADVGSALHYLRQMFTSSLISWPHQIPVFLMLLLVFFILIEWMERRQDFPLQSLLLKNKRWVRWSFYYFLIALIYIYGGKEQEFIYFQF